MTWEESVKIFSQNNYFFNVIFQQKHPAGSASRIKNYRLSLFDITLSGRGLDEKNLNASKECFP